MIKTKKPMGYWTKERCLEEALKYHSKREFRKNADGAYDAAFRNNWLDDICKDMTKLKKPNGYWTKEKCLEEANKYYTRNSFNISSKAAYAAAYKNGWLDDICKHMTSLIKPIGFWSFEICKVEALKYNTKKEFREKANGAYDAAKRNNWIDDICEHMEVIGNKFKKCIYGYFFKDDDNSVYIGITSNFERRHKDRIFSKKVDSVVALINQGVLYERIQLTEYLEVKEAIQTEINYIKYYRKTNGFNCINISRGGEIGGSPIWTKEKCFEEALKYNAKKEFRENSHGAYLAVCKNEWIEEVCSHMTSQRKRNGYWTKERCFEEAIKYHSKREFEKNSISAYGAAQKNKWLNDICGHMKLIRTPKGHWSKENCQKEAIKYSSRTEFNIKAGVAYRASLKNNWLDEFFPTN